MTFSYNPGGDGLLNLTPGDIAKLQKDGEGLPFDVKLLVESVGSVSQLGSDAHQLVQGNPHAMVLAIDPVASHVAARFGKDTGVKQGDFDTITKAGNASFHNHDWASGIEAVMLRAQASAQTSTGISQSSTPVVVEHGLSGGTWLLIVLLGAGLMGLVVYLITRSKKDRASFESALDANRLETGELLSRNVEEMTLPGAQTSPVPRAAPRARSYPTRQPLPPSTPYVPDRLRPPTAPTYSQQPVIVQQNDGLLEGVLIGEMLSRPEREVVVERDVPRHHRRDDDSGGSSSSFDGGDSSFTSTTSTDDDSGGSDSSYDGGSSSFDTGSSDSGGGGSDGGGSDSSF